MSPAAELRTILATASPELREVLGRIASDARAYQEGAEGPVAASVIDTLIPLGRRAERELAPVRRLQFLDGLGKRHTVRAIAYANEGDEAACLNAGGHN